MDTLLANKMKLQSRGAEVLAAAERKEAALLPSEKDFAAFNVYDANTARYLSHDEARAFLTAHGVPAVMVLEEGASFAYTQEELLARAEGKYDGTDNEREGIVIRPRQETTSLTLGGRLSFKAISNRFLLKEKD